MSIIHAGADVCRWSRAPGRDSTPPGIREGFSEGFPSRVRAKAGKWDAGLLEKLSTTHLAAVYSTCGRGQDGQQEGRRANCRGLVSYDCNALEMTEQGEGFYAVQ